MVTFYKHFMIQYKERDDRVIVTSIIAHGNFQCVYGERIYASLDDVKSDIDSGRYGH